MEEANLGPILKNFFEITALQIGTDKIIPIWLIVAKYVHSQ